MLKNKIYICCIIHLKPNIFISPDKVTLIRLEYSRIIMYTL